MSQLKNFVNILNVFQILFKDMVEWVGAHAREVAKF